MEKDLSNQSILSTSPQTNHRSFDDPKSIFRVLNNGGYFNPHGLHHQQNQASRMGPISSPHSISSNSNSPSSDVSTSSAAAASPTRSLHHSSSFGVVFNKPAQSSNPMNYNETPLYENYFSQEMGRFGNEIQSRQYSNMPPPPAPDWQSSTDRKQSFSSLSTTARSNSTSSDKISTPTTTKRPKSTFPFGKCKVCNDKATGVHYGITTCEGCKGFFKRSTLRKEKYRCFFGNNCPLTPDNRNRCKACRFKKCLDVGMSIQGVKMGRIPKAEKERALMNLSYSTASEKEDDQQYDEENSDLESNVEEVDDDNESKSSRTNLGEAPNSIGMSQNDATEYAYSSTSENINHHRKSLEQDENSSDEYPGIEHENDQPDYGLYERSNEPEIPSSSSVRYSHHDQPSSQHSNSTELSDFGSLSISVAPVIESDNQNISNKRKLIDQYKLNGLNSRSPSPNESSSKCLATVQNSISSRVAAMANMMSQSSVFTDRRFTFMSDLLNIHKTFKSPNSLLPCTRLSLANNQKGEENSRLDDSIQIILALLINRVYQIYVEHSREITEMLSEVKRLIAANGVRRSSPLLGRDQVTLADVWDGLLEGIPKCVKGLIAMARELPGINELNTKDFTAIINSHLFNYYLLRFSPLYIDGENYNLLSNNIQYTRHWMLKVIGEDMVDALFAWTEKFNELELTTREIALLFPYLLTIPEGNFEDPVIINNLNDYYYRALLYEFDLNHRTPFFITRWKEVMGDLPRLNELQAKSIGKLTPVTSS